MSFQTKFVPIRGPKGSNHVGVSRKSDASQNSVMNPGDWSPQVKAGILRQRQPNVYNYFLVRLGLEFLLENIDFFLVICLPKCVDQKLGVYAVCEKINTTNHDTRLEDSRKNYQTYFSAIIPTQVKKANAKGAAIPTQVKKANVKGAMKFCIKDKSFHDLF